MEKFVHILWIAIEQAKAGPAIFFRHQAGVEGNINELLKYFSVGEIWFFEPLHVITYFIYSLSHTAPDRLGINQHSFLFY